MSAPSPWSASIVVRRPDPESIDRLARALGPEAAREVPRARAAIARPDGRTLELRIEARDTGALRAALNTYLGWVALATATEHALDHRA